MRTRIQQRHCLQRQLAASAPLSSPAPLLQIIWLGDGGYLNSCVVLRFARLADWTSGSSSRNGATIPIYDKQIAMRGIIKESRTPPLARSHVGAGAYLYDKKRLSEVELHNQLQLEFILYMILYFRSIGTYLLLSNFKKSISDFGSSNSDTSASWHIPGCVNRHPRLTQHHTLMAPQPGGQTPIADLDQPRREYLHQVHFSCYGIRQLSLATNAVLTVRPVSMSPV